MENKLANDGPTEASLGWRYSASGTKIEYLKKYVVGNTVLDIGCGRGWYSIFLKDRGFNVYALDVEKQFDDERINFTLASAQVLPYPDHSFDTVLMWDVLEHIEDEQLILEHVARVCRKRLILSVPNRNDRNLNRYNLTYQHFKDKSHCREYGLEEIQDKLRSAGFRILLAKLEGPVMPQFFVEFLRFSFLRLPIRKVITLLCKIGFLSYGGMYADIFVVADKVE